MSELMALLERYGWEPLPGPHIVAYGNGVRSIRTSTDSANDRADRITVFHFSPDDIPDYQCSDYHQLLEALASPDPVMLDGDSELFADEEDREEIMAAEPFYTGECPRCQVDLDPLGECPDCHYQFGAKDYVRVRCCGHKRRPSRSIVVIT